MDRLNKFRGWLLDLLLYAICYGIGLLLAQYFTIPPLIYYPLFLLLGFSAVIVQINPSYLRKFRYIPLLQGHFGWMYRINRRIGQSVHEGTMKSAIKFTIGMLSMSIYCFWINTLLNSLKWLISLTLDLDKPFYFQFQAAFLALFGAGVGAYLYWLIIFTRDTRAVKAQMHSPTLKKKMSAVGQALKIGLKIYTISQAYLIWVIAEVLFLLGSPDLLGWILIFVRFVIFFYILLVLILLLIFLVATPKPSQPNVDINIDNSIKT